MKVSTQSYYKFWAKTGSEDGSYHLLPYHNLDVAAVGHVLLLKDERLRIRLARKLKLSENALVSYLSTLLALHDLGKFAESFQNLNPQLLSSLQGLQSQARYLIRHDTAGWLLFRHSSEKIRQILFEGDSPAIRGCKDIRNTLDVIDPTLRAIFGHHGMPPEQTKAREIFTNLFPCIFELAATEFVEEVCRLFLSESVRVTSDDTYECDFNSALESAWTIAGFAVVCDWIGSNYDLFPFETTRIPLSEYWETRAIPQAEHAIKAVGILPSKSIPFTDIRSTFSYIEQATPLQKLCSEIEIENNPQLFVIEDTTGAGKTEAAIILAHRLLNNGLAQSVYFALPSMATANGVFERVVPVYKNLFDSSAAPSLVLAHSRRHLNASFQKLTKGIHSSVLDDQDEPGEVGCAAWFADSKKKSLLASFGIGTIDQALVGVLPIRHQSLRLFGSSRSVLIIDEIHAFDTYVTQLICTLLEFQGNFGSPVILVSATIPKSLKEKFINAYRKGLGDWSQAETNIENPYPALDVVTASNVKRLSFETRMEAKRTLNVTYTSEKTELLNLLSLAAETGKTTCWIRNSIEDAVEAFREVRIFLGEHAQVTLFHSRFCHGHRQAIEERILSVFGPTGDAEVRRGQIIIATQVVEQSLDLDFDVLITDLCPIDLVIQRAGRLMRHSRDEYGNRIRGEDRRGVPHVYIYGPALSETPVSNWYSSFSRPASFVYPHHGRLYLTAIRLASASKIEIPTDFRSLIEGVYGQDYNERIPENLKQIENHAEGGDKSKTSIASINALRLIDGYNSKGNEWSHDVDTPTRLNDGQHIVTLVMIVEGRIISLIEGDNSWELSEVSLPNKYKPLDSSHLTLTSRKCLEKIQQIPEHRWRNFLLVEARQDYYIGRVRLRDKDDIVEFRYDKIGGLQFIDHESI